MSADRGIDPARGARRLAQQRLVKRLAHAVEPLEFEAVDAAGIFDDARHGQGIMRGKLRK